MTDSKHSESMYQPTPLFDVLRLIDEPNVAVDQFITHVAATRVEDAVYVFEMTLDWLRENRHSENNYKSYRSEITTFLNWCFLFEQISVQDVKRSHLSRYIDFCTEPPIELVGHYNVPQFIDDKATGQRVPNPKWRAFVGKKTDNGQSVVYRISTSALKTKLAILSTFFTYLIDEEYMERNPAMTLMRAGRFKDKLQSSSSKEDYDNIKAFSELQWSYVYHEAQMWAEEKPNTHERTLFLISLMYCCYLRISEVSARSGYNPVMGQFRRDPNTGIWSFFIPKSKGGKRRSVALSRAMMTALRRYRTFLGLSELPAPREEVPLFIRLKGSSHGRDRGLINANLGDRHIRDLLKDLFARAADRAEEDGLTVDAAEIRVMTPHSLRHTGISHDINLNQRPLSHVQADAGHDSIDTTSKYLHTSRQERHESASGKLLDRLED